MNTTQNKPSIPFVDQFRPIIRAAWDEGWSTGELRDALEQAMEIERDALMLATASKTYSKEGHEIEIIFAPAEKRDDGQIIQLEIARCSCGWKTQPLSYWDARNAASAHAKHAWRESRE